MPFNVSEIPCNWPEDSDWVPEKYNYYDVWPAVSKVITRPPKHINLEAVVNFLFEEGFAE